jgi:hypothetical protein
MRDRDRPPYNAFPPRIRGGKHQVHVYIGDDLFLAVGRIASESGITRSSAMRALLREGLLSRAQKKSCNAPS